MITANEASTFEHRIYQPNADRTLRTRRIVPIWKKGLLTLEEAAAYTGLGVNKLRMISNDENCGFVLWNGSKRLLKRRKLDEFLEKTYSI